MGLLVCNAWINSFPLDEKEERIPYVEGDFEQTTAGAT